MKGVAACLDDLVVLALRAAAMGANLMVSVLLSGFSVHNWSLYRLICRKIEKG